MKLFSRFKDSFTHVLHHDSIKRRNFFLFSIVFWGIILGIFYLNAFHEKYPDEFDNILGGQYILHGIFPFSGFFSHHGPVAYFVASLVQIFSGPSFVTFRIGYAIFLFLLVLGTFVYLRKTVKSSNVTFYYLFAFLLACAGTYYWMHMLIADSLSAFLLLPVFAILFIRSFYTQKFSLWDLIIVSICTLLVVLSAVTYIYLAVVVFLYTLFIFWQNNKPRFISKQFGLFWVIFVVPVIIFFLYLLVTGSLNDYIQQSLLFNQRYYIYNYPGAGENGINPIRYAVMTVQSFLSSYQSLFVQIPHFNFAFPLNVTFALGNMVLMSFLLFIRKYTLSVFVFLLLVFSNMRSNPLSSAEKDYQAAVYIIISLFLLCFIVFTLYKEAQKQTDSMRRIIFSGLFILLSGYFLATVFFLFEMGSSKAFAKYMGDAPKIYDRPEVAPILNQFLEDGEKVWIGPLEFEEMYYLHADPATKYHFLIPGMGRSPQAREEMIAELSESKPNYIWFDKNFFILGQNPQKYASFFTDYIEKNYTPVGEIEINNSSFISAFSKSDRVDVEGRLYVRNDNLEDLTSRLVRKNIIKAE